MILPAANRFAEEVTPVTPMEREVGKPVIAVGKAVVDTGAATDATTVGVLAIIDAAGAETDVA
jgi:hypothetical protein